MKFYERMNLFTCLLGIGILSSAACTGIIGTREPSAGLGMTVFSINIRYDNHQDGEHGWASRKALVAATLRFHKADLAGLQEALRHQIEDLADLLPGFSWIGVGREDGAQAGEHCPIFYRNDRFQLLESGTFWLSESPQRPGSRSWDAALPRIVTWAKLRDTLSSRQFFFFNTHFDHRGREAREKSAALILRKAEEIGGGYPVVLTGDFNFTPESRGYHILTAGRDGTGGFLDALDLADVSYGGTQTYNGFDTEIRQGRRIDFIFLRNGFQADRFGVIADRWGGRFVSDHYPVLAEIR